MLNKIVMKLGSMLRENDASKNWSSTRFSFLLATMLSNIIIFIILTVLTIKNGKFPEIPEGVLWLYALANGLSFAGKVSQKTQEVKSNAPSVNKPKDDV